MQPLSDALGSYGEALLRWPGGGSQASPGLFIPFAEQHGLIDAFSLEVFRQAVAQLRDWMDQQWQLRMNINLST